MTPEYIRQMREALTGLVNQLDIVHADPKYRSAWTVALRHAIEVEHNAAKAALALAVPEPEKEWAVKWPSGALSSTLPIQYALQVDADGDGTAVSRTKAIPPGPWVPVEPKAAEEK